MAIVYQILNECNKIVFLLRPTESKVTLEFTTLELLVLTNCLYHIFSKRLMDLKMSLESGLGMNYLDPDPNLTHIPWTQTRLKFIGFYFIGSKYSKLGWIRWI